MKLLVLACLGGILTRAQPVRADVADLPNSFVAVELPAPSGWTGGIDHGLVMDLNQQGVACGWADDGTSGQLPYVFDPTVTTTAIRGTMTLLPTGSYDCGVATAITEEGAIGGSDYPTIVGYVYDPETISTPEIHRACYWQYVSSAWTLTLPFGTTTYDSEAWAIAKNGSTLTAGGHSMTRTSGARWEAFQYNIGTTALTWFTNSSCPSLGWDISADGPTTVGSRITSCPNTNPKAYYWDGSTATSIHPSSGYSQTEVLGQNTFTSGANTYTDLCGWGKSSPAGAEYKALLWVENPSGIISYDVFPLEVGNNYANDLNDEDEVVGTIFDVVYGTPIEAFLWVYDNGSSSSIALTDAARFPYAATGCTVLEATCINDAGWVGGSFVYEGTSNALPCLLIPTDADNNGVPDFRDIIADERADTDPLNSVPDDFEGMRVGLYGAAGGSANRDRQFEVDDMHAVRYLSDYEEMYRVNHPEDDVPDSCIDFGDGLEEYGDHGYEIIFMLRSRGGDPIVSGKNYDYLPPYEDVGEAGTADLDRAEAIGELAVFSNTYARCLDYIQFGNEFIGGTDGPGTFYYDSGSCTGELLALSGTCLTTADVDLFNISPTSPGWYTEQLETALAASALAGRPLRFVGPAIYQANIRNGIGGDPDIIVELNDKIATVLQAYFDWANEIGAAVDLHVHYTRAEWATDEWTVTELIDYLFEPEGEWVPPQQATCLEWSPIPQTNAGLWYATNIGTMVDYFDTDTDNPSQHWNAFVLGWSNSGTEFNGDLHMSDLTYDDDLLDILFARSFLHACYGNFTQNITIGGNSTWGTEDMDVYAITALYATDVVEKWGDNGADAIPPDKGVDWLREALEAAAANYDLNGWVGPHDGENATECGCEE